AGTLGPAGNLESGPSGGAATDAAEKALQRRELASRIGGVFIFHLNAFVDDLDVEHVGNEAGADALNGVAARLELLSLHLLRDDRTVDWLDRDGLHARLARLDHLADARDRATGAHA